MSLNLGENSVNNKYNFNFKEPITDTKIAEITAVLSTGKMDLIDQISSWDFTQYYFNYFKLSSSDDLAKVFDMSLEDVDEFRYDLALKEDTYFDKNSRYKLSNFIFQKRLPGQKIAFIENQENLGRVKSGVGSSSSFGVSNTKGGLDYYDNVRDDDGQYRLKYGKFYED